MQRSFGRIREGKLKVNDLFPTLPSKLLQIDDEANDYGFRFVTNAERAAAKKFGITTFPTLVVFRHKEPLIYEGI